MKTVNYRAIIIIMSVVIVILIVLLFPSKNKVDNKKGNETELLWKAIDEVKMSIANANLRCDKLHDTIAVFKLKYRNKK